MKLTNSRDEPDYTNCPCGYPIHPIIEDVCPRFIAYQQLLLLKELKDKSIKYQAKFTKQGGNFTGYYAEEAVPLSVLEAKIKELE